MPRWIITEASMLSGEAVFQKAGRSANRFSSLLIFLPYVLGLFILPIAGYVALGFAQLPGYQKMCQYLESTGPRMA
jgi:hypothetical protein